MWRCCWHEAHPLDPPFHPHSSFSCRCMSSCWRHERLISRHNYLPCPLHKSHTTVLTAWLLVLNPWHKNNTFPSSVACAFILIIPTASVSPVQHKIWWVVRFTPGCGRQTSELKGKKHIFITLQGLERTWSLSTQQQLSSCDEMLMLSTNMHAHRDKYILLYFRKWNIVSHFLYSSSFFH